MSLVPGESQGVYLVLSSKGAFRVFNEVSLLQSAHFKTESKRGGFPPQIENKLFFLGFF